MSFPSRNTQRHFNSRTSRQHTRAKSIFYYVRLSVRLPTRNVEFHFSCAPTKYFDIVYSRRREKQEKKKTHQQYNETTKHLPKHETTELVPRLVCIQAFFLHLHAFIGNSYWITDNRNSTAQNRLHIAT